MRGGREFDDRLVVLGAHWGARAHLCRGAVVEADGIAEAWARATAIILKPARSAARRGAGEGDRAARPKLEGGGGPLSL